MIGPRLKELRTSRQMSLRELGKATGLSATLLSQIERGVTDPSLKTLRLLADHFGQSIAMLFQGPPSMDAAHVTRPDERMTIGAADGQVHYRRVTHGNGQLEVLHGTLGPGEASSEEAWGHEAVECTYVLGGELTVEVDGESFVLGAGEAITLCSRRPHRYVNAGEQATDYLVSVTPPTP